MSGLVGLMIAGLLSGCVNESTPSKAAPDFRVAPLKPAGDVKLSAYRGKPVLLYFWATWCGPCKEFAPALDKLVEEFEPKGVKFMAISGDSRNAVSTYEANRPHKAEVFLDPDGDAQKAFGVTGLPSIFVVSGDGQVIHGQAGLEATTYDDLKDLLTAQTKESAGKS
jgi:thiol-disulfide isomerase/thioredoxin